MESGKDVRLIQNYLLMLKEQEVMIFLAEPYSAGECDKPDHILWDGKQLDFDYRGKTCHIEYKEGILRG